MRLLQDSKIDKFIGTIELGVNFFQTSGKLLVELLDENPHVFEDILAAHPPVWLTRDVLDVFEQIGRNQLAVETMFLPRHVISRLVALPKDAQIQIATNPVPVVRRIGGRHVTIKKSAKELTPKEARQAIGPVGVVPPEQQAAVQPKLISCGKFELTLMNGKPFLKQGGNSVPHKVVLDGNNRSTIEIFREGTL